MIGLLIVHTPLSIFRHCDFAHEFDRGQISLLEANKMNGQQYNKTARHCTVNTKEVSMAAPKHVVESKQKQGKVENNSMSIEDTDEAIKMTLYIKKSIAKAFKKAAIDEEVEFSELANIAFTEYVQNHYPAHLSS